MAITITTNEPRARKRVLCIHGAQGVGKTTFGLNLGKALLVPVEDGFRDIACDHVGVQRTYTQLMGTLLELYSETDLQYDTIVIDSVDWAESLIEKDLDDEGFNRDYGRGVAEVGQRFKRIIDAATMLSKQLDVNVVLIAHSQLKRLDLPCGRSYDQWQPKLSKKSNEFLVEGVDEVGFAYMETVVNTTKGAFNAEKGVGKQTGRRLVSFKNSAQHVAKNRAPAGVEIPDSMVLDPNEYSKFFL